MAVVLFAAVLSGHAALSRRHSAEIFPEKGAVSCFETAQSAESADTANSSTQSLVTLQLSTQDVIDFDHQLTNRIQNGSFELGLGSEPIYVGWRLEKYNKANGDLTPPDYPVIDTTVAKEGRASLKISGIRKLQRVHIDFKAPDVSDEFVEVNEFGETNEFQGYLYMDIKTDHPNEVRIQLPHHTVQPGPGWTRYRDPLPKTGHSIYDYKTRRINILNDSGEDITVWFDGITWCVNESDAAMDHWLRYSHVEAVFLPERDDGIHFADRDVVLTYRMDADESVTNVIAELHLRDISRGGEDLSLSQPNAQYVESLTVTNGEVIGRTINLHRLKHGAYMAHLAFYDPATKEILGVATECFTVMADLSKCPPPVDFVVGTHGGLLTFGRKYEFSARGSWSADDFYKTCYLVGLRAQRLLVGVTTLMPYDWRYTFNLIKGAIEAAHRNGCTSILCFNPFRQIEHGATTPHGNSGDWIYEQGHNLYYEFQNSRYDLYALPVDKMKRLYDKVACAFGDKLIALENVNELNLFCTSAQMSNAVNELFVPIYDVVKKHAPDLPVLANFTMDFWGANYTTSFMDAGGVNYSDGFTYHPYAKTYIYYREPHPNYTNGLVTTGIKFTKKMQRYVDRYKDQKHLITGMTEIHGPASKCGIGWDVMQRVLLDWAEGAIFSAGILPGGLYFIEAGNAADWTESYTKAPGMALVAVNAMHAILGGYKFLKRVDWENGDNITDNHCVFIAVFKKPNQDSYAVAFAQGDFGDKSALVEAPLPSDAVFYDQWGEEIMPEMPLKLSTEITYMKTDDASVVDLFNVYTNAISWTNEPTGYEYEYPLVSFVNQPSDSWFKTVNRTGIPPRTKR